MLNFLFWNIRGRGLLPHIDALVEEHAVDVLVLAESMLAPTTLLGGLRGADFQVASSVADVCQVAVRRATCDARLLESYARYSFYRVGGAQRPPLTLVALHAPSKRFYDASNHLSFACELQTDLRAMERRQQHDRTLLVGDFNMDPFEPAMVSAAGLHAVLSRDVAEQGSRTVGGREHDFLFNPMWSLMGLPGAPGSYFYRGARPVEYFWHTFDQVILRPALLPHWKDSNARLLSTTRAGSLVTTKRRPDGRNSSDHLPLLFQLHL